VSRLVNAIRDSKITFALMPGDPKPATLIYVLLVLASFADDDGTNCWPSVARLCRSTRLSRRSVQSALRVLEWSGAIEPIAGTEGGGRSRTTNYAIRVGQIGAASAPFLDATRNRTRRAETAHALHMNSAAGAPDQVETIQGRRREERNLRTTYVEEHGAAASA